MDEQRLMFMELCRRGSKAEVVKFLKRNGKVLATVKDADYDQTPLHISAEAGRADLCLYLIEKCKADVNAVDKNGWTPLHSSASAGHVGVLEVLLNHGAFARALTNEGASPLHYFVRNPSHDPIILHRVLQAFVERGADVDQQNKHGEAPLHQAAMRGRTQCVLYLLNNGASPNIISHNGETPLHFATRAGHKECMNVLLQWGADPTIESRKTGTCIDIATRWNDPDMIQMLMNHFKDFGKEPPEMPMLSPKRKGVGEKESGTAASEEQAASSPKTRAKENGAGDSDADQGGKSKQWPAALEDDMMEKPMFKRASSEVSLRRDAVQKPATVNGDEADSVPSSPLRSSASEPRDNANPVIESKKANFSRGRSNSFSSVRAIRSTFEQSAEAQVAAGSPPRSPGTSRLREAASSVASSASAPAGDAPSPDSVEGHVQAQHGNKYGTPRTRKLRTSSAVDASTSKSKRSSRVVSLVRNFERFAGISSSDSGGGGTPTSQSEPNVAKMRSKSDGAAKSRRSASNKSGGASGSSKLKQNSTPDVGDIHTSTPERSDGEDSDRGSGETTHRTVDDTSDATHTEKEATGAATKDPSPRAAREDLCPPRLQTAALSDTGKEALKDGWTCSLCKEQRSIGVPLAFFARGPDDWEALKENRDKRSRLSSDVCSIDNLSFFIRGLLRVQINQKKKDAAGSGEELDFSPVFTFGLWVKVSTQDFFRALEEWSSGKHSTYDGVLNTRLPLYPDTNGLKVRLTCQNNGVRPSLEILTSEHELVSDWKTGMSLQRFEKLLVAMMG